MMISGAPIWRTPEATDGFFSRIFRSPREYSKLLKVVLGHEIQQVLYILKFRAGKLRISAWF